MTTAATAPAQYFHGDALDALIELGVSRARAINTLNEAQYGDTLASYAGARPVELYGVEVAWNRTTGRFTITPVED